MKEPEDYYKIVYYLPTLNPDSLEVEDIEKAFRKTLRIEDYNCYRFIDFFEYPEFHQLDVSTLNKEQIEALEKEGFFAEDANEDGTMDVSSTACYKSGIYPTDIPEFDQDMFEEMLDTTLNEFPWYLVYVYDAKWDGSDGYKIVGNLHDVLRRDYEHTDELLKSNGDVAEFSEASHDVPMGSLVYILGLTEKEKADIDEEFSFKQVKDFVNEKVELLDKEVPSVEE